MRLYTVRFVGCLVILGLLALLSGCAQDTQAMVDLAPLQVQLASEYGSSNLVIGLQQGSTLCVTVARSPSAGLGRDQGAQEARDIAEFVCANYRSMDTIEGVRVTFEMRQERFLADVTASVVYTFERSELVCEGG
jgi:hypothetical protein